MPHLVDGGSHLVQNMASAFHGLVIFMADDPFLLSEDGQGQGHVTSVNAVGAARWRCWRINVCHSAIGR